MYAKTLLSILISSISLSSNLFADELKNIDISGFMGIETRMFTQDPQYVGQKRVAELSLIIAPEFRLRKNNSQFSLIPFYRHDNNDEKRSHFDLREAYWLYSQDDWDILIGQNKVFWGVTESRHLVDIINQKDLVEDFDEEEVLGQPMINISKYTNLGQFELYILPYFRERTFAGNKGRLRPALTVDTNSAIYESKAGRNHIDLALRWSHYFGNWDIGLSHFYGTGREPRLVLNATETQFIPYYNIINQSGVDVQYTLDNWLFKFEGIAREGQGDFFTAATTGLEYSFYQIFNSSSDISLLAEYNFDGRHYNAPENIFDNDIFAALRFVANDVQDTEILAGVTFDPSTNETFYNIEAERRISDSYKLELRSRFFTGADVGEKTYPIHQDDYIQLNLSRYF